MKPTPIDLFRDPDSGSTFEFEPFETEGEEIIEGVFRAPGTDIWYPVTAGVPRLLSGEFRVNDSDFASKHGLKAQSGSGSESEAGERRAEQSKTNVTFSDKWKRFKQYGFEPSHREFLFDWYCKKLGVPTVDELKAFYAGKARILEVGPGSGFNARFMAEANAAIGGEVHAVDISEAADSVYGNNKDMGNVHVVQADLMNLPYEDGTFDFAIADGVLHHTPNTRAAVEAVYQKVKPGGQFFFYVYRKMGAARYFVDQHIRDEFMGLEPEACYDRCRGLTELGRELSRLDAKITLEHGVPELGIPAGEHDVQRLLYYNFVKCYWNDAFDWETNNMVNFDWYHPHNAWQHSDEEVKGWLADLGVTEFVINPANPNGISCLLTKPA